MNTSKETLMYQILGLKKLKNHVGIEIEVEYKIPFDGFKSNHWEVKSDGSLRYYGYEYITRGPISIDAVPSVLKEATEFIASGKNNVVCNSPRTSVHVHSNILNKTFLEMANQIIISWLLENAMIKFCNPKLREGNLFCLRVSDAEQIRTYIQDTFDGYMFNDNKHNYLRGIKNGNIKYCATNLRSIAITGTIEYRSMCGGDYNYDMILNWVNAINAINESSSKFKDPEEVMDFFYKEGVDAFIHKILGDSAKIITESSMDYHTLLKDQEGLVMPFAYRYDWQALSKKITEQLRVKETIKVPMPMFAGDLIRDVEED